MATGAGPGITMKRMPANGTTLAYVGQGRGTPVVFVHGAVSDHRLWGPQRDACAARHRFIALDQRRYGESHAADDGAPFSLRTRIDDLSAFLHALAAGPVHLVGWSMSGATVLGVTMAHPHLVASVYLHEPVVRGMRLDPESAAVAEADLQALLAPALAALRAGDRGAAVRHFFDGADGLPGTFDAAPAPMRAMVLDNAATLPLQLAEPAPPPLEPAQLQRIAKPVAISRGEHTRAYYRIQAEALYRHLPYAQDIVVPRARHLWPLHSPAAFNRTLLDFIAGCEA
jgi:pimeloyl-ACP methyl ester carboxylesterase